MPTEFEQRVLVLAPTSRDAALTQKVLSAEGIACVVCQDVPALAREMERGVGAVVIAEEVLLRGGTQAIVDIVARQPPWSDLPVILVTRQGAESPAVGEAIEQLGNVILLERPTRILALANAARSALRARLRQFQTRDHIRARIAAAGALEESEQRFRTLVEQIRDYAIFMLDLGGRATSWNEGVRRVLGFGEEEFVGIDVLERLLTQEDLDQGVASADLQVAALTGSARSDRWMRRRDGTLFWASGFTTSLRDEAGNHIGYTIILRDMTVNKEAEEALRQADRRKDEFLATLAHELRNPLAPIRNALHILQLTSTGDPTSERLCETMDRQVSHLVRLVDDLLEVSRITRGKIALRKERVDLREIVKNAIETSRPLITAAGITLEVSMSDKAIIVGGDAVRLGQVFANLLNNAAKYTDTGGKVWLSSRIDGGEAVVSVRDSGIGIPVEMLGKVFDMFMQVDRSTSRAQGGLGIGLTLVRSLVELHRGSVSVRSDGPGTGSEFVVRLPLATGEMHGDNGAGSPTDSRGIPARRILVVDDNVDSANTLGTLLKFLGGDVEVAHDGASALEAMARYHPEVVLLDIGMPGMDGFEVARRIREQSAFRQVVLIALTGWGQEDDRRRTREAGFDHHLVKPADIDALQSLLVSV